MRVGLNFGVASQCTSFVAVERKDAEVEKERRDQEMVGESPPSGLDDGMLSSKLNVIATIGHMVGLQLVSVLF